MKSKRIRLEQAKKAVEFINLIDEVSAWMNEAEDVLNSEDMGKDVETAKMLLKKQATLESELYQQEAKLINMKEMCAAFEKENHFAFLMLVSFIFVTILVKAKHECKPFNLLRLKSFNYVKVFKVVCIVGCQGVTQLGGLVPVL